MRVLGCLYAVYDSSPVRSVAAGHALRLLRSLYVVYDCFTALEDGRVFLECTLVILMRFPINMVDSWSLIPSKILAMHRFLHMLEITFRRDPTNHRPRINKIDSVKDREQKQSGNHFCLDDDNSK